MNKSGTILGLVRSSDCRFEVRVGLCKPVTAHLTSYTTIHTYMCNDIPPITIHFEILYKYNEAWLEKYQNVYR